MRNIKIRKQQNKKEILRMTVEEKIDTKILTLTKAIWRLNI